MDVNELRTLTDDDLNSEVEKARAKIFKARFQGTGENVEKVDHRVMRRHVARLLTVMRERKLKAGVAGKDVKA
jgi:ribosomal protein L29